MAERGQRPLCSTDHERWVSDDRSERESAARECAGCPLLDPCRASGADEVAGVWGGVDRISLPGRPAKAVRRSATTSIKES